MVRLHAVIERASDAGLALATHTPILVIKEVNGSHAANRVMSLFPRSKMIFMLRDGRDVLDSLAAAYEPGAWLDAKLARNPLRQAEDRLAWIDETCRGWVADVDICMKAYDEHDPALRRMLRYEELLADTPTVLRDLLKWIGLPSNEPRIERIADSHRLRAFPSTERARAGFAARRPRASGARD